MKQIQVKRPNGEKVNADVVPFSTEQETFSVYTPNVPEGHPLYGRAVKMKNVVVKMLYLGEDELGEPIVQIQSQQLVAVE